MLVAISLVNAGDASSKTSAASVIEFSANEQALLDAFGPWPIPTPPDAGNELSGNKRAEQLGVRLFHEPRLSASGTLSCASCHEPSAGFIDARAVAIGAKEHVRNTQTLFDVGLQRWFGWDGGADSLWAATLRPLLSDIEMAHDIESAATQLRGMPYVLNAIDQLDREYYLAKSSGAAHESDAQKIDAQRIDTQETDAQVVEQSRSDEQLVVLAAKSIAAYVRTIRSAATPYDNFWQALRNGDVTGQSAYPDTAKRGLKLFLGEANCSVCHFGPNFSNREFHDTGRPFFTSVGRVDSGRYSGIKRVRADRYNLAGVYNGTADPAEIRKTTSVSLSQPNFGQWRTPSLRALSVTAPYMHDGSLPTLRDVVDAYADINVDRLHANGETILKPQQWTEQQRQDLVAFLESLSAQPSGN